MLTPHHLRSLQQWLGQPVVFAPAEPGKVRTHACVFAAQRSCHDAGRLAAELASRLNHTGFKAASQAGIVEVDLTAGRDWLDDLTIEVRCIEHRVKLLPPSPAAVEVYGTDAARWAWLLMAGRGTQLDWGQVGSAWATRTDANPLALVRRAHSRSSVALTDVQSETSREFGVDAALRTVVALTPQLADQANRTSRTRGVVDHAGGIARATLHHLETADRTDLHALRAARRLMAHIAHAAAVTLPVPF